ncbi:DUF1049 domain-containing protein [Spiribacter sp. C176]|uniref:DUF1049 domain-containing protein n=1 Tax=Spiribacter salilacus TaxID=2664894 RepID=A0A6N7QN20_9GAMM|nr:LapA family protein [Spiribacter salilacus]MRH77432.1 DUF1049 domain-containing protein [Spiribacter salilacus]
MRRVVGLIFAIILIALGLSFAMLNPQPVALDFYFGQSTLPLSLALVMALAIGAFVGVLVVVGIVFRQRWQLRRLNRQLSTVQSELSELRKLPIRHAN